eukprot:CAMPEP_0177639430 /NCGR_PEP_ID=MMETSP0447-20121125/6014_1 /TAXON_ID=0 /ORGANISM="Stygamoeba regulata, Strain BSH-02190019" /LENGTH=142 /DNA_ID=CAMNT_0019141451 /DNA_START=26 /DNA_END=454 /DNA_ORIENTATION=-
MASSTAERILKALRRAEAVRPKAGGFPVLAECLRQAGVIHNHWALPSCQCIFTTSDGAVVQLHQPLISGMLDVPRFHKDALICALRADQAGHTTFPEFLAAVWNAGVVRYDVNFAARTVTYCGVGDEQYVEEYPSVELAEEH